MFPIRDENPQLMVPYVTYALIGINVLCWVFLQGFGSDPELMRSICQFGLIPADVFGSVDLAETRQQLVCPVGGQGRWATVLSSMFMHGGWMHIIGNMWFLWIFGDNVEDAMGRVRFAIFYLLCGLAAAGAQMLANPSSPVPMVGASGAIGGVMGAYVILYPRVHVHLFVFLGFYASTVAVPAMLMLGYWMAVQVFGGFSSIGATGGGVAFWAHIGGFAAGAILVWLFKNDRLLDAHPYHGWRQKRHSSRAWHRIDNRRR